MDVPAPHYAKQEDEGPVFAKLQGKWIYPDDGDEGNVDDDFEASIRSTSVKLGRRRDGDGDSKDFLALCAAKSISRHHATIEWDRAASNWRIACVSKNGVVVDKVFYGQHASVPLFHGAAVKIGPLAVYFLLPSDDAAPGDAASDQAEMPQAMNVGTAARPSQAAAAPASKEKGATKPGRQTYTELVLIAFESNDYDARADGVSSTEVRDWISHNIPVWQNATPEQLKLLSTGVQGALYRSREYEKIEEPQATSSRANKWRRARRNSAPGEPDAPPAGPPLAKSPPAKRFKALDPEQAPPHSSQGPTPPKPLPSPPQSPPQPDLAGVQPTGP
ncbi:hypothetical protein M885DRAFT_586686 [Pelagophyceae sp. CCMP2097]|nr:hypothetical protein M885DRAFT_586686 [Pelagophyceae sp. CCMP2097]